MRFYGERWVVIIFAISLLIITFPVMAQNSVTSQSVEVEIYRDGVIHVTQEVVSEEIATQIEVQLLSINVENLGVFDQNNLAVDYSLDERNLVIYSFGASKIQVEYDTNTITNKEKEVWTLLLNTPYNVTVYFPINSTIVYLNGVPKAIDTSNDEIKLQLNPGQWEVSYILQFIIDDQDNQNPIQDGTVVFPLELIILLAGVISITGIAVILFILKKKNRFNIKKTFNENPQLMKEDKEVIEFLVENQGKAFEAEIRKRFPDVPRTSLWRLVKRLEKLEIVEVKKIGLENQVILKK
ncbi:MAG: hypothetical protein PHC63_05185 [Candidatus Bathyarchaeota archaeon]|nr:hypothetical protein [Candidatus Bathyarchaeota archaeon]